jgi:hypothetical protein
MDGRQQPVAPAAPAKLTKKEVMETGQTKQCAGYNRVCTTQIGLGKTSGLCSKCYANKNYHDNHPPKRPAGPVKRKAKATAAPVVPAPTGIDAIVTAYMGEDKITISLTAAKLDKMILSLPLDVKAQLLAEYLGR